MSTQQSQPLSTIRDRGSQATFDVVVARMQIEATGVLSLELAAPNGSDLPSWDPGAHVTLHLAPGLDRDYSLCGPLDRPDVWRVAVLREPESRGGSEFVHSALAVGSRIEVTGPRNGFPLVAADEYLLIAGGIGVTPILPMVQELERRGAAWSLLYGGRTHSSMAFLSELECYGNRVQIRPEEVHGRLDLAGFVGAPRPDTVVYCCGPEPLLKAIEHQCTEWPAGALHLERFRADAGVLEQDGEGFEIELADSGLTLTVAPGQSIVEVLESAGISVATSCGEGTCGTCETPVLDGVPDHRDSFLTDDEKADNSTMMICTSRALTPRLVLEL